MVGTMTPRMPGLSASHSISATARVMSWQIGTSAMPPRRSGLVAQRSTRKRLWARAPANASSGSSIVPADRPAPNGGDSMPGDRVGVGEDHLGRDAVGVELLVALLGVVRAAETFLVRRLPVGDVVVVQLHLLVALRVPLGEVGVERVGVRGVEVRPVVLARQPGVRVGRDDRVPLGRAASISPACRAPRGRRSAGARTAAASRRAPARRPRRAGRVVTCANSIDTMRPTGMSAIGSSGESCSVSVPSMRRPSRASSWRATCTSAGSVSKPLPSGEGLHLK